jgi:REP element-mobilizing transposase RayT
MPYSKVYLHAVWSTKNRIPFLKSHALRQAVWGHISDNATKKEIYIDTINGYEEHCHCLVALNVNLTISKTLQLIKGESSFWINQQKLCKSKFEWQDDYFVVSVSPSMLDRARRYINNQEEHHKKKSFMEEYNEMVEKFGFKKMLD